MTSSLSRTDRQSFEAFRHPAFVRAVNRAANLKCIEAIKSGKLRVVAPQSTPSNPSEYTPRMDLIDDPAESNLTAVFEIPGIKTSDVSLHILDGHLVVLGERGPSYNTTQRSEARPQDTTEDGIPAPNPSIPIQELRYGTFRRSIRIPDGLKESDVKASLNEGMLTVTWPRSPAAVRTRRPHTSSPPTSMATAGTSLQ
ncbi:hypothetical protein BYT27DRAFT_7112598 [Phlegmacium glaucopus]|nr:hypothetical protein BYT27DRAFT_7112598 [Phlegmacium glaucopus]